MDSVKILRNPLRFNNAKSIVFHISTFSDLFSFLFIVYGVCFFLFYVNLELVIVFINWYITFIFIFILHSFYSMTYSVISVLQSLNLQISLNSESMFILNFNSRKLWKIHSRNLLVNVYGKIWRIYKSMRTISRKAFQSCLWIFLTICIVTTGFNTYLNTRTQRAGESGEL